MDPTKGHDEAADDDFEEAMRDSVAVTGSFSDDRAARFYDRMRLAIRNYLEKKGSVAGKSGEYLLLVPDVFMLLWRLVKDPRVSAKDKLMLGSGIAYYIFPLDLLPEAFMGPLGYADDLVFAVFMLHRMLSDTDPAILREHWSGREDVLAMIQKVLNAADQLVGSEILSKLKKKMKW